MGMYTGLRFKGIVKKEFRDDFEPIAMKGLWEESKDLVLKEFGEVSRASSIPCGSLCYMPDEWEDQNENATDGFERTFNKETGYWSFQCSLKNYSQTIEQFFNLLPYFMESIEHLEYFYEEWEESSFYTLENGAIISAERQKKRPSIFVLKTISVKPKTEDDLQKEFALRNLKYDKNPISFDKFLELQKGFREDKYFYHEEDNCYFLSLARAKDYATSNIADINDGGVYNYVAVVELPLDKAYAFTEPMSLYLFRYNREDDSYEKVSLDLNEETLLIVKNLHVLI